MLPVVLLHGSRTSATMWRRQVEALTAAGVPVLAPDLPGHGARRDVRFTLDDAVATVHDVVDDAGGRALVVGLSLGGYVGIEHRARHPGQSAGLVAASCCTDPATPLRAGWLRIARWIERWPDSGARLNAAAVHALVDTRSGEDLAAGGYALDAMSDVLDEIGHVDARAALAAATSPVRLVNGQWDHFRGQERSMLAAARRGGADARIVVIPHARHLVSLDQPVAFTRAVLEAHDAVAAPASPTTPVSRPAGPTPAPHP
ncbi:pimeloyl-ACP methyl ester carboxylesterase [Isoptericola jiangsuensis]|uniref:Pimeloyl-ACP methyl ester carboxylesterase n=1 Tax=Isoptericola jiangsuensis TaxID=548579 RepID=A0A2A9EVC0_9MICO|nr:alpha/beta hydrolase [Isoptericola jiangsuensis]PFG42222.1 pimeloyl-ACP methyl ester carboxylesterase [Isoptericola jiangsuensis]